MIREELTQIDILRRMTPGERLRTALDLYWSARELKAAVLRVDHPEWSVERVEEAVREAFHGARS